MNVLDSISLEHEDLEAYHKNPENNIIHRTDVASFVTHRSENAALTKDSSSSWFKSCLVLLLFQKH